MSLITEWRQAVQARLEGQLADVTVVGGPPDVSFTQNQGKQDVIHVWWPGWQAMQADIALAQPTLLIRWYPLKSKKSGSMVANPDDPTSLEDAAVRLMEAMKDVRKFDDLVARVACYISQVTPVTAPAGSWYVEAVLQGVTAHLATSAA